MLRTNSLTNNTTIIRSKQDQCCRLISLPACNCIHSAVAARQCQASGEALNYSSPATIFIPPHQKARILTNGIEPGAQTKSASCHFFQTQRLRPQTRQKTRCTLLGCAVRRRRSVRNGRARRRRVCRRARIRDQSVGVRHGAFKGYSYEPCFSESPQIAATEDSEP
jgi:hypothetical protein